MIIRKTIYPKTERLQTDEYTLTEKVDGSNMGIFKLDGEVYIAQRNIVFKAKDYKEKEIKGVAYKGIHPFLEENLETLQEELHEGAAIFGEWVGMGRIDYKDTFKERFLQFAKGNITPEMDAINIVYDRELFKWSFVSKEVPSCIGEVPFVGKVRDISPKAMEEIYDNYCEEVGRTVEGFIIISGDKHIKKYVRHKGGKASPHYVSFNDGGVIYGE